MTLVTPGKARRLQTLTDTEGRFAVLAADHRDSLRVELDPEHPDQVDARALTSFKLDLVCGLGDLVTGVLLDPVYGAAQAIVAGALPPGLGFFCALEAQGYGADPHDRRTVVLDDWSIEKAARLGAAAIKLLIFYNPDLGEAAEHQEQLVREVVAECAVHDLPFLLEPVPYDIEPDQRPRIVVETARRLGPLGPDVLKQPFPVDASDPDQGRWRDACAELDEVAGVPWALLSGGDPYPVFVEQLRTACAAGCSGFMVGRSAWREALAEPPATRADVIRDVVAPRFVELREIASAARPWTERHELPAVDDTWYASS
jgi:tagatose 1,6-diphosphate aldolase